MEATLLALVLKPHAIRHAPMKDEPRYPAGRVIQGMPPDMEVAPPSLAGGEGRIKLGREVGDARDGAYGQVRSSGCARR